MFGVPGVREMVSKMAFIGELNTTDAEDIGQGIAFLSGTEKYFLLADVAIDVEAERSRITTELEYTRGFVSSVEKKLSNERFVAGAPADVVAREQQKLADGKERIRILEESLNSLN
jgi:valyl-tRNA synthetase